MTGKPLEIRINEDQSGMNIDREIAEKVMGWKTINEFINIPSECWVASYYYREKLIEDATTWSPSTDIEQAFEVVEKMRERSYLFSLWNRGIYYCSFWSESGCELVRTSDKTPAMAICKATLAALKAVEE